MKQTDVIVIGGGLAGLIAAAGSARRGKKVIMLTKGAGTLAIGGGSVDVLGYDSAERPVASPAKALLSLPENHPYRRVGMPAVEAALQFFRDICQSEGYAYRGSLEKNFWIPTAVGTLKPTCLVPYTMDPTVLHAQEELVIVGFQRLKDYYPQMLVKGLAKVPGYKQKNFRIVMLDPHLPGSRDITALEVARWLDTAAGRQACGSQMSQKIKPGSAVLMPPVLGTQPDYEAASALEKATGSKLVEAAGLPPAITGLRLRKLMLNYLRKCGVNIIENAAVTGAAVENGICLTVKTANLDRERNYQAQSFILAGGGFFGGGLQTSPGQASEPIFALPVTAPADPEKWGEPALFAPGGQPFAKIGLAVNAAMQPVDGAGKVLLNNVLAAGRNLAGYDFCCEKSGNGVAIVSGYQASLSV